MKPVPGPIHNVNELLASGPVGSAVLQANGPNGWRPAALMFPAPVEIMAFAMDEVAGPRPVLDKVRAVLAALRREMPRGHVPAGLPMPPLAVLAIHFEFGAALLPSEVATRCFHSVTGPVLVAALHAAYAHAGADGGWQWVGHPRAVENVAISPDPRDPPATGAVHESVGGWEGESQQQRHAAAVERIRALIRAGDCYQVNLTVPFRGRTSHSVATLWQRALAAGGAGYMGAMHLPGGAHLLSLSPELLLRVRGRDVETRPIKGTRPDRCGASEALLQSPKDRAEHVMIVDLERNDLGRVCETGSIRVEPLLEPVTHPTVIHLESVVRGRLRQNVGPDALLSAVFPGGSVTGAPKRRVLEVVRELEPEPRGIYCGGFGWMDAEGDLELNLPIRTAVIEPDGRWQYGAGGGITIDSEPEEEWREVLTKAAFWRQIVEG